MSESFQSDRSDADAAAPDDVQAPGGEGGDVPADETSEAESAGLAVASSDAAAGSSETGDPNGDAEQSLPALARKRPKFGLGSAFAWPGPIVRTVVTTLGFDRHGPPASHDTDASDTANEDLLRLGPPDAPDLNMTETDSEYTVLAALPGLKASDIRLTIENKHLSIDAEHETCESSSKGEVHITEFTLGSIHRTLELPGPVGKAEAEFSNGLLSITLTKKPLRPRRIRVKTPDEPEKRT